MTDADFEQWESAHILATGANPAQLRESLEANRGTFRRMGATYADLCEASERAIAGGGMNWPNEHVSALVRELKAMREERQREQSAGTYGGGNYALKHPTGCDCPGCNGGEVLPSYDAKRKDLESARKKLQKYIVANGGTLLDKDGRKQPRKRK